MIDLETLGTSAGCAVVSIGAQVFDELGLIDDTFYQAVRVPEWDMAGYTAEGLRKQEGTIDWWEKQSAEARAVFTDPEAVELDIACSLFASWWQRHSDACAWGNGADFDLPILQAAFQAVKRRAPWKPYNGRCYRTVKNMAKGVKMAPRTGTHHNALADARDQALHLIEIVRAHEFTLA